MWHTEQRSWIAATAVNRVSVQIEEYPWLEQLLGGVVRGEAHNDILQALMALGYNERDANAALKALPPGVGVSDGIKLALKALNR